MKQSEIPRRIDMQRFSTGEKAISNAVDVVEEMGADPLLTDAVALLGEAQSKVADFIDKGQTGES